jgi:thioesterase domain-containing protein
MSIGLSAVGDGSTRSSAIVEAMDVAISGPAASVTAGPAAALSDLASTEDLVAAAWGRALRRKSVDRDTGYWTLGMNANRAAHIIRDIWSATSIELPVNVFFEAPTIRRMAAAIYDGSGLVAPDLVRLRDGNEDAPLFLFPGGVGVLIDLTDLVRALDYPGVVYGIPFSGLDGIGPIYDRIETEAARSLRIIRRVQQTGPYRLIGYSLGGITALETARLILKEGDETAFLGLLDSPQNDHSWPFKVWLAFILRKILRKLETAPREMLQRIRMPRTPNKPSTRKPDIINPRRRRTRIEFRFRNPHNPDYPYYSPDWVGNYTPKYSRCVANTCRMKGFYMPSRYDGKLYFFASTPGGVPLGCCDPEEVWPKYLPNAEWIRLPGNHLSMMIGRHAVLLAGEISERLKQVAPAS